MFYPRLFENPNAVYVRDHDVAVPWDVTKTYAFSYYGNKMYIGSLNMTHMKLYASCPEFDELANERLGRGRYSGRIFEEFKVIAFWDFPEDKAMLMNVLSDIENASRLKFDDEWKIEIPNNTERGKDEFGGWGSWYPKLNTQQFVSIEDYEYPGKRKREDVMQGHVDSPIKKEMNRKAGNYTRPRGFGSDKTSWDSPNNIVFRQKQMTSESKK